MKLFIVPLDLDEANALVERWHRHHKPVRGHKFSIGVASLQDAHVCGAAIVGRPVSRVLDRGWTLEVLRCVTDGTQNACSALYAAAWRAARAMGYEKLITYTLKSESGTSLKAAGWREVYTTKGGSWNTKSRPRVDKAPTCQKRLWAVGEVG